MARQNRYVPMDGERRWNPIGLVIIVLAWVPIYFGIQQAHKQYDRIMFKPNDCSISCHQNLYFKAKVKNLDTNLKRRHPNAYAKLSTRAYGQMDQSHHYVRVTKTRGSENDNGRSESTRLLAEIVQ